MYSRGVILDPPSRKLAKYNIHVMYLENFHNAIYIYRGRVGEIASLEPIINVMIFE